MQARGLRGRGRARALPCASYRWETDPGGGRHHRAGLCVQLAASPPERQHWTKAWRGHRADVGVCLCAEALVGAGAPQGQVAATSVKLEVHTGF